MPQDLRAQIVPPEVDAEWTADLDEYEANLRKQFGKFLDDKSASGPPDRNKQWADGFVHGERNSVGHPKAAGATTDVYLPGSPFGPAGKYHGDARGWSQGKKTPPLLPPPPLRKVKDAEGHEHAADGKFGTGGTKKPAASKPIGPTIAEKSLDSAIVSVANIEDTKSKTEAEGRAYADDYGFSGAELDAKKT